MTYRIELGPWGEFPEWRAVELAATEMSARFETEREAERAARELDRRAWALWDRNHPDASTEEREWATDHAPAFSVAEVEE